MVACEARTEVSTPPSALCLPGVSASGISLDLARCVPPSPTSTRASDPRDRPGLRTANGLSPHVLPVSLLPCVRTWHVNQLDGLGAIDL